MSSPDIRTPTTTVYQADATISAATKVSLDTIARANAQGSNISIPVTPNGAYEQVGYAYSFRVLGPPSPIQSDAGATPGEIWYSTLALDDGIVFNSDRNPDPGIRSMSTADMERGQELSGWSSHSQARNMHFMFMDDSFSTAQLEFSSSPGSCRATNIDAQEADLLSSECSAYPGAPQILQLNHYNQLPARLEDISSELVEAYFTIVCPLFSTFDSQQNTFRSFVMRKWQDSGSIFYAMLSMAAAKLSRQSLAFRRHALEYQSLALQSLRTRVSKASSWTTELLFVVLMLGLSTSWHDVKDLGIAHLQAVQNAILNCAVESPDGSPPLDFFKEALIYWEMITCFLNEDVTLNGYSVQYEPEPSRVATSQTLALELALPPCLKPCLLESCV
ncbi:uncharacterized protein A1O5_06844 [Cladophialophora psammophila CBS 110553]|uniref:Transcription factor domain-containing protein n=1 Tax=Cladophialophora psammophila CBS 110553 TaxID=1182543 RepID=W9WPD8_9EURO|nr:uncharacterized protein A1O5_06844 [Cladophialophora psammophila CBS 110553]EXJ69773.1 hypothetical protein A1O5_06844 [Cladophialophora psammophila CBS 110553]